MRALVEALGLSIPGRLAESSLVLGVGTLACVIGPNGSGKTSLLHAVAGIGSARGITIVDGHDPSSLPPAQRQRLVAYLSASRDIKWPLVARDLIALGLPPGVDLARVSEELELAPLLDRRIDQLSTGERSRVLIARALAAEPRLLLLDEPSANLDPLWQLRLMDLLKARTRSGQSVLMALHDLDLARRHADRLILMHRGNIVADGDAQAILSGAKVPEVFGIEYGAEGWRPVA